MDFLSSFMLHNVFRAIALYSVFHSTDLPIFSYHFVFHLNYSLVKGYMESKKRVRFSSSDAKFVARVEKNRFDRASLTVKRN